MNPNHEPQADIPSTYRFRFPLSSFINSTSSDGSYMPVLDLVQGSVTAVSFYDHDPRTQFSKELGVKSTE